MVTSVRPAAAGPFSGSWRFDPQLSNLTTPAPKSWIAEIMIEGNEMISVREQVIGSNGSETAQSVRARFDGSDYRVEGSPIIDSMAYIRTDHNSISGLGKKNGALNLTETISTDPKSGTLSLAYELRKGERILAHGTAVFVPDEI